MWNPGEQVSYIGDWRVNMRGNHLDRASLDLVTFLKVRGFWARAFRALGG